MQRAYEQRVRDCSGYVRGYDVAQGKENKTTGSTDDQQMTGNNVEIKIVNTAVAKISRKLLILSFVLSASRQIPVYLNTKVNDF